MSKKKIFWGVSEKEYKKQQEQQEIPETIDEALAMVNHEFKPDHKAYSIAKIDNKFRIICVDLEISTLQSDANVLSSVYDYEYQAIVEMNRLLAEQSKKFRK